VPLICDVTAAKGKHFSKRKTCDWQKMEKYDVRTMGKQEKLTYPVSESNDSLKCLYIQV
jgi:hypothetical protein